MLMPIVQGSQSPISLTYSADAQNVNLLTDAVAAGFDSTAGGAIDIVILAGVTISGSASYAIRTGVFPANSIVTITNAGTVSGYTGTQGTVPSNSGTVGGDAFYAEFTASGSSLTISNSGTWGGGGGGGGGGGLRGGRNYQHIKGGCVGTTQYGSHGANGANGALGVAGTVGADGTYGAGDLYCETQLIGAGAAGSAAGYAVRKNGLTITTSGTFAGTVG